MLKKIKDWVGSNLDVYKVENANDVGAGLVRHIWKGEETASQIGTTLTAQIMNDLQKGLVHTLNATKTTGTNKDIYEVVLSGIEEFGVFDGLKLLIRIDRENQYDDVFLKLGGAEYSIYRVKENSARKLDKGVLKDKKEYLLNYSNNSFVLSDSTLYGTTAGTSLEGNRLAEILGIEYGGNIQDTGNKVKGKFYFDSVTKFYYECIENTNLTYNESSKFRAISNKPLSDKLENLYEVIPGTLNASQIAGFSSATLYKKAGVVFLNIDDNQRLNGRTEGNVILTLPDGFRPRNRTSFSGNTGAGQACVFNVETDGRVILMSNIKLSGYLYFNVSFLAK
nr:MAG TPA: receptor binding protein [Caudoviricetes sp.]